MAPDGSSISSPFCVAKTPLCHGLSGLSGLRLSQGPRAPGKDKQALPFDCKALGSLGHSLSLDLWMEKHTIHDGHDGWQCGILNAFRCQDHPISRWALRSLAFQLSLAKSQSMCSLAQVEMVSDRRQVEGDDSIKKGAGGLPAFHVSFPSKLGVWNREVGTASLVPAAPASEPCCFEPELSQRYFRWQFAYKDNKFFSQVLHYDCYQLLQWLASHRRGSAEIPSVPCRANPCQAILSQKMPAGPRRPCVRGTHLRCFCKVSTRAAEVSPGEEDGYLACMDHHKSRFPYTLYTI